MLFYLGGALGANAWLIKGFFDTIPRDLDESAQIDGATHNQTFFRRSSSRSPRRCWRSSSCSSFISSQAEFLVASVIMFGKDISLAGRHRRRRAHGLLAGDRYDLRWGPFAIGALHPRRSRSVLLFQFLQRYIVSGITAGRGEGLT